MRRYAGSRGLPTEERIDRIERHLSRGDAIEPLAPSGGGGGAALPIDESDVTFQPDGHHHDGTGSAAVDHANLLNITADDHHAQGHEFTGSDHLLATLSAADDGKMFVYDHATGSLLPTSEPTVTRIGFGGGFGIEYNAETDSLDFVVSEE